MNISLYIDADGCPVKEETYRVGHRHQFKIHVVANKSLNIPMHPDITMHVVPGTPDAADNWIAENIQPKDICITADIPLADRCLKVEARAIDPRGNEWTEDNIGDAMATRELMKTLREMGEVKGGPSPMGQREKSAYLSGLEQLIQKIKRGK